MLANIRWILHGRMSKIFNYITETSSKNETFRIAKDRAKSLGKEVTAEVIPTKQQLEDTAPPWKHDNDSIVVLLWIALGFKEAFFELENMDPDFKSINLTKEQWDHIRDIYECYEDLTDESFLDHWSSYKTANMYFPMLCSLYKKALVWLKKQKIGLYSDEDRWFTFTELMDRNWCQSNLVLAVAAVLDPRFKMDIVEYWYKKIYGSEWETQLTTFRSYFTGVYNEYAKGTNDVKNSSISYKMLDPSGKPRKSSRDLDHVQSLNFELHLYFEAVKFPLFEDFDILKWWRVNAQDFPTLARMARDFLAVQISSLSMDEREEIYELADEDEEAESSSSSSSSFN
ncbi:hypothetical protein LWI29_010991 [Acer saccharum]|uniref:HAT C-terminal dimerisation domain-containing protein n=1 Tax=Acer saccharum TaxID=4024 RepID=A0AA39SSK8_ACESA|nr:hypothetical protein LWI29_010991 [Acer saccharum]